MGGTRCFSAQRCWMTTAWGFGARGWGTRIIGLLTQFGFDECGADRIYALKDGREVEAGDHAELLAQGGVYADLYNLQFRNQEHR